MKNKIYTHIIAALLLCGICTGCSEDVFEEIDIMDIPVLLKGTFPTEGVTLEVGKSYTFEPKLKDDTNVQYSWMVNGAKVSSDPTYIFETTGLCQAEITCIIANEKGKITLKTSLKTNHDFTKGFFVVTAEEIGFYDTQKTAYYPSCYQALNKGEKFNGDIYAIPNDDKLYVTVKTNVSNRDHLFVIDKKTLQKKSSTSVRANLFYSFALDDRYMLLAGHSVYRYDTKSQTSVKLSNSIYPFIFRVGLLNDKLLLSRSYGSNDDNLYYYDLETVLNAEANQLPDPTAISNITQCDKSEFVKTADGSIFTLYSSSDDNEYKLLRISNDLTTEEIALSFAAPTTKWYDIYFPGIVGVSSTSENFILIPSKDHAIYKYVVGDASSLASPFIASPNAGIKLTGSGVQVDTETQKIYVLYSNSNVAVYNYDGTQVEVIELSEAPQHLIFTTEGSN
ncbi:MAG: DUF5074 domain-containing protein [Prevotellaceae bacterium]|jgi:hypothetical protein|nr:DUF5074 domain-containing protein [Prevotellaceae bacterium]